MTLFLTLLAQAPAGEWQPDGSGALRGILSLVLVLGLIALLAWLLRRGSLGVLGLTPGRARGPVAVEAAVPLGERRSLMVVSVEGRRLLLGLTPSHVSLVTELQQSDVGRGTEFGAKIAERLSSASERPS